MRHFPVGKRVRTYERNQRNELSEDREPLCVHSVGNEAGEHSWWYLSFLRALATRMARAKKSRVTTEKNHWKRQAIDGLGLESLAISASSDRKVLSYDRWPPPFSHREDLERNENQLVLVEDTASRFTFGEPWVLRLTFRYLYFALLSDFQDRIIFIILCAIHNFILIILYFLYVYVDF